MIYIFLLVVYSFAKGKINKYLITLLILILYMSIISLNKYMISFPRVVLQSVIHLKLFLFYHIVSMFLEENDVKSILKILFIITILGMVTNIFLGTSFYGYTIERILYRTGMLRLIGFQFSSNNLGLTLGLFYLYYIFKNSPKIKFFFLITLIFTVLIVLTGSRTALIAILIGILFYYFKLNAKFKLYTIPLFGSFIVTFVIWVFSTDIIERTLNNFNMTKNAAEFSYIRGIMLSNGLKLFRDYFPIGTGAATFGSVLSEGSKVYDLLGLSGISYFINMDGVYDSNFASIAGEFGFVGITIFVSLCLYIYKRVVFRENKQFVRSLFAVLLVYSFTTPVFMNAYPAILFSLFFVLAKIRKDKVAHENFTD